MKHSFKTVLRELRELRELARMVKGVRLLLVLGLIAMLLAMLPAKADPQNYIAVPVTNITTLANGTAQTNINATYAIPQNSQVVYSYTVTVTGTNNTAGTITFCHNLTVGDGNWTTHLPITNTMPLGFFQGGTVATWTQQMNYTNFTGFSKGRLDYVLLAGATNVVVNNVSVGYMTQPGATAR